MSYQIDLETKRDVIKHLNSIFGSDINNLSKSQEVYDNLSEKINNFQNDLSKTSSDSEYSKLHSKLSSLNEKIDKELIKSEKILCELIENKDHIESVLKVTKQYADQISVLEKTITYLNIVKKCQKFSDELSTSISKDDEEMSVTLYANLCEISLSIKQYNHLAPSLSLYVKDVIHHWHDILKTKLIPKFNDLLETIKWPFVGTNLTVPNPSNDTIEKFQLYTEYLFEIQLPEETFEISEYYKNQSKILIDFPPLSLPIYYMLEPLKKRFAYHFHTNRKTNRSDKPEWYMTQVLKWIKDHERFVCQNVQTVAKRLGLRHINARVEFIRGLVQLCVEKLYNQLPAIINQQQNNQLFSHYVDEILSMDRELFQVWEYPRNQPGPIVPLTSASIFQKWLLVEKMFANEKLDVILSSQTAWSFLQTDDDCTDKITECADCFVNMLTTMCQRWQCLPQPGHKLQFLNLEFELLEDFRIRVLQLVNSDEDTRSLTDSCLDLIACKHPYILNTLHYIINHLYESSNNINYISLYYFKNKLSTTSLNDDCDVSEGGVFEEIIKLYNHLLNDLLTTLCKAQILDVKARSRPYRHDNWSSKRFEKQSQSLSLSTTACPILQTLTTRLHQLNELLVHDVFANAWKLIAKQLNEFLFDELVLVNRFNDGGAQQLAYDVNKNLLPIFAQYTRRPQTYFVQLLEACTLLTLSKGSALLLLDTLNSCISSDNFGNVLLTDMKRISEAFNDLGIKKLSPHLAISILKLRTDLS